MTEFVAAKTGETEQQWRQFLAYLFAQSSVGKASTGVLSGLTVAQTATASGSVLVSAGAGVVQASTGDGASPLVNPSQVTIDVLGPNPIGAVARNDVVVFDAATASIRAITGTPNAVPTDPTVPTSAIPLARLRHAGSGTRTTIPTSTIDPLITKTTLAMPDVVDTGWVTLSLTGSFYTAGSIAPAARRIGNVVYFRGHLQNVNSTSTFTTFANLPASIPAPSVTTAFPASSNTTVSMGLQVTSGGAVGVYTTSSTAAWTSLAGISYPVG
jgi:hypothetical protein